MRTFFYLLVVINLAVFAWYGAWQEGLLGDFGGSTVKGPSVPALVAAKVEQPSSSSGTCYKIGPFTGDEGPEDINAFLHAHAITAETRSEDSEVISNYWVFVPALASDSEASALLDKIRGAGIQDSYVLEAGANRNAVSLGLFRDVEAAKARVEQLSELGFTVQMQPRLQQTKRVRLRLPREAGEQFSGVKDEFSRRFPDAGFQALSCE